MYFTSTLLLCLQLDLTTALEYLGRGTTNAALRNIAKAALVDLWRITNKIVSPLEFLTSNENYA